MGYFRCMHVVVSWLHAMQIIVGSCANKSQTKMVINWNHFVYINVQEGHVCGRNQFHIVTLPRTILRLEK